MSISLLLLIVLLFVLFGGGGYYGYRRNYYSGRGLGIFGVVAIVLLTEVGQLQPFPSRGF